MSLVRIEVSKDVEGGTNKVVLFNSLPSDRFVDFAVRVECLSSSI
jgi:hypothetical protein